MHLVVGTDSTWSLRVWICAQLAKKDIKLNIIDLSAPDYKAKILLHTASGLVPALLEGDLIVHDSLAIAEYFNECAKGTLYPIKQRDRALARSLCAELHSGFISLRSLCPFTLDKVEPLSVFNQATKNEISRLQVIFEAAHFPFMFESAGAVDAFYCILAYRLQAYGIKLTGKAGEYQQSLLNWHYLQQAIKQAEHWRTVNELS